MKIFNFFFCFVFVVFAALQYNDPDPYVWIPIYLYAAVLCALAARKKFYPNAYWLGISVYAVYAVYKFFCKDGVLDWIRIHHEQNIADTMKASTPWVEETREFFGLVILIVVLLIDWLYGNKVKSKK
ncbi:MAG: transmembrane 220 family protein [Bacteroidetes bacterium]|nr:transmembrane 220 family protein [Bacteroidota bacterium]